jgi:hypothetical protein
VQAVDFVSDDPAFADTMTTTWEITAVPGGARLGDQGRRHSWAAARSLVPEPQFTIHVYLVRFQHDLHKCVRNNPARGT